MNSSKFVIKNKYNVPTGDQARKYVEYKFSNYNLETVSLFLQYGSPTFIPNSNINDRHLTVITIELLEKIKSNQKLLTYALNKTKKQ